MKSRLDIAFFGSSLVSAHWNGAATYYRGIIRALAGLGHRITFYEPDAYDRQQHRDIDDPDWAQVVVYSAKDDRDVYSCLEQARRADLVVKASGVGVFDELLEREVLRLKRPQTTVVYWDVDAPATLQRLDENPADPFLDLVPQYDWIFTYGGGAPVVKKYGARGAAQCVPIYNALDPQTHHPVPPDQRFVATLSFLGNRLPDREARVHQFFFQTAALLPNERFLLAGSGWQDNVNRPANVDYWGHLYTKDHNAFNCTPLAVLNISRESMARNGFSPATRVFEAAGAGACLITDAWEGIEEFLEPDDEVLMVHDAEDVARHLRNLTPQSAREIGKRARERVLREHTYDDRAAQLEQILCGGVRPETSDRSRRGVPHATA